MPFNSKFWVLNLRKHCWRNSSCSGPPRHLSAQHKPDRNVSCGQTLRQQLFLDEKLSGSGANSGNGEPERTPNSHPGLLRTLDITTSSVFYFTFEGNFSYLGQIRRVKKLPCRRQEGNRPKASIQKSYAAVG